eukprot:sb/3463842/
MFSQLCGDVYVVTHIKHVDPPIPANTHNVPGGAVRPMLLREARIGSGQCSDNKNIGNRLLLLLTITDILTCVDFSVVVAFYWGRDSVLAIMKDLVVETEVKDDVDQMNIMMDDYPLFCWLDGIFRLCSDMSVIVTCVLCVTRCVVFTRPFLIIKNWIVYTVLGGLAVVYFSGRTTVLIYQLTNLTLITSNLTSNSIPDIAEKVFENHAYLQILTIILLIAAGVSCFYSGWSLYKIRRSSGRDLAPDQVSAVYTVGILGLILIIANLGGTISFFVLYGDIDDMKNDLQIDFTFWDLLWINYIALTFNSCFNPAVYLVRTKALREYAPTPGSAPWRTQRAVRRAGSERGCLGLSPNCTRNHAYLQILTIFLLIAAGISCFYSGWSLYKIRRSSGRDLTPDQVSAVYTVGILGLILIIANLGGTISFFVLYGDIDDMKSDLQIDFTFWDLLWINYIALTFNSCFNPAVYLVRTKALREYAGPLKERKNIRCEICKPQKSLHSQHSLLSKDHACQISGPNPQPFMS